MKRLSKSTKMRGAIFALLLAFTMSVAAQVQVRGTVTDANGEPLIGATVQVQGTTQGTITDINGSFTLSAPAGGMLVVSFMGHEPQTVPVSANVHVRLVLEDGFLDELIVTAYGVTTRSSFTGAAGVVTARDISNLQVSNLSRALEGLVPGLQVAASGGQPGSDATMRIRGYGSLAAGNAPLIVLDGAVFNGSLNSINPQDIESITVLRDAASAALYGSRAANGVIIVTTRRGEAGRARVNIDTRQGINVRGQAFYDRITDPGEYLRMRWMSRYNENVRANIANPGQEASAWLPTQFYIPFIGGGQVVDENGNLRSGLVPRWNDCWINEMFRVGHRNEVNLSVSSGTERSTSFFSLGYLSDEGIVQRTGFERFSVRLNSTYNITENLTVGANLAYSRTEQNQIRSATVGGAISNTFGFINSVPPIYPVFLHDLQGNRMLDADGRPLFDFGTQGMDGVPARQFSGMQNPVAAAVHDRNVFLDDNVSTRGHIEYRFLDGFRITANFGYDVRNRGRNTVFSPLFGDAEGIGRVQQRRWRTETMTFNQLLHYNRTFGLHNISALVGHETYEFNQHFFYAEGMDMFLPDVFELDNTMTMSTMESFGVRKALQSYLSQILYNYAGRYFFSASFRRDGSSVFHPNNRWGNFWSVGGSWRISEETFMRDIEAIDNLRLRVSYGTSGNDVIMTPGGVIIYTPYRTLYELDPSGGLTLAYRGNPDLRWERNNNFNVGLDGGFFRNRLRTEIDFYVRNSSDLLFNRPQPISAGISFIPENVGSMRNTGIEFTVAGDIIRNRDFGWTVTLIGGHNRNRITELPQERIIDGNRIRQVGGTIHDFYLTQFAGVNPDNGNPMWYHVNADGDRVPTETAAAAVATGRVVVGSALPDFVGGLNMSLRFRQFDLNVMTNFQIGGYLIDGTYQGLMHSGSSDGNWHVDMRNAWTATNRYTNIPRLDNGTTNLMGATTSDMFLIGADFFGLRSITLGYNVPASALQNTGLSAVRISLSGDNMAIFSRRTGMDPRQSLSAGITEMANITGVTQNAYTPIAAYSIGISLSF